MAEIDALLLRMRENKGTDPRPNRKTFLLVISALSHSRNVKGAKALWTEIESSSEHCALLHDEFVIAAMTDCLSRNGEVRDAHRLVTEFDAREGCASTAVMWMTLMNGCRVSREKALAQLCFEQMRQKFPRDTDYASSAAWSMR